jgi:hypothetical protein
MQDTRQPGQRADIDIDEELRPPDIDADPPGAFDRAADGKDRPAQHRLVQDEPGQRDHDDQPGQ